jgi:hypothetical protein
MPDVASTSNHAEGLIKITGSIPRNTEHTVANTTQGKLQNKKEAQKQKANKRKSTHCQHPTLS